MKIIMSFIIKPLITEKMTNLTEKFSAERTFKAKTGKHRGEMVIPPASPAGAGFGGRFGR